MQYGILTIEGTLKISRGWIYWVYLQLSPKYPFPEVIRLKSFPYEIRDGDNGMHIIMSKL